VEGEVIVFLCYVFLFVTQYYTTHPLSINLKWNDRYIVLWFWFIY